MIKLTDKERFYIQNSKMFEWYSELYENLEVPSPYTNSYVLLIQGYDSEVNPINIISDKIPHVRFKNVIWSFSDEVESFERFIRNSLEEENELESIFFTLENVYSPLLFLPSPSKIDKDFILLFGAFKKYISNMENNFDRQYFQETIIKEFFFQKYDDVLDVQHKNSKFDRRYMKCEVTRDGRFGFSVVFDYNHIN